MVPPSGKRAAEARKAAIHMYVYIYIYVCVYIYRERERCIRCIFPSGKRAAEARKAVDAADAKLEALQEKVLAVGGIKLRAQKSKVETLGEQLGGVRARLTKTEV